MAKVELISRVLTRVVLDTTTQTIMIEQKDKNNPDTGLKTVVVLRLYEFLTVNLSLAQLLVSFKADEERSTTEYRLCRYCGRPEDTHTKEARDRTEPAYRACLDFAPEFPKR